MKKKLLVIIMLFVMISWTMFNYRQPVKYVVMNMGKMTGVFLKIVNATIIII